MHQHGINKKKEKKSSKEGAKEGRDDESSSDRCLLYGVVGFMQQRNVSSIQDGSRCLTEEETQKEQKGKRSRREVVECYMQRKEAKTAKTIPPTADPFPAVITSRRSLGLFVISFTPHTRALKHEGRRRSIVKKKDEPAPP